MRVPTVSRVCAARFPRSQPAARTGALQACRRLASSRGLQDFDLDFFQTELLAGSESSRASQQQPVLVDRDRMDQPNGGYACGERFDVAHVATMPLADSDIGEWPRGAGGQRRTPARSRARALSTYPATIRAPGRF